MRRCLLLFVVGVLSLFASVSAQAAPFTLNFSEAMNLNDPDAVSLGGNEFGSYGISTLGAYLYRDSANDNFGDGSYGLSVDFTDPYIGVAGILFDDLQSEITYDWINLDRELTFIAAAVDNNGVVIDIHEFDGVNGLSGTDTFTGTDIAGLVFADDQFSVGSVAVTTLSYDRPAQPIPEPSTMLLLGLGGLGAVLVRRRRA